MTTQYKRALEAAPVGAIIVDPTGAIVFVNAYVARLFGFKVKELVGLPVEVLLPKAARDGHARKRAEFGAKREPRHMGQGRDLVGLRKDGTTIEVEIGLSHMDDGNVLATIVDSTHRREAIRRMEQLALTDALTELANRRAGEDALRREIARSHRYQTPVAILVFDIDNFKQINDAHGHPYGDHVIRQVARTATIHSRIIDVTVRWGGEEFLMIMPRTATEGGVVHGERLRVAVERAVVTPERAVTISLGLATVEQWDADRPRNDGTWENQVYEELLALADQRLLAAKAAGKNRLGC